jgi:hypothetical protein
MRFLVTDGVPVALHKQAVFAPRLSVDELFLPEVQKPFTF